MVYYDYSNCSVELRVKSYFPVVKDRQFKVMKSLLRFGKPWFITFTVNTNSQ